MALIKCRECDCELSSRTIVCPDCGSPLRAAVTVQRRGGRYKAMGTLMILGGVAGCIGGAATHLPALAGLGIAAAAAGFLVFLVGRLK